MRTEGPVVSVFTACKNSEKYIRSTLDSIISQSYRNIEIVIADGESTDRTLEIIKEYSTQDARIKWKSEPDNDALEGFFKAMKRATGKYLMLLPISDLYLDKNWISKCVDVLESRKEVSLVHGYAAYLDQDGAITGVPNIEWLVNPPPTLEDFTAYYLATYAYISELTYCVRREIFMRCFTEKPRAYPKQDTSVLASEIPEPFFWFLLEFFKSGFLAHYIPVFASGGRIHGESRNKKFVKYSRAVAQKYKRDVSLFRSACFFKTKYDFLNSDSKVFKSVSGIDLFLFKLKIFYYRLTVKPSFGYGWNIPLFILSKIFLLVFENPKNFILKLYGKIKNTMASVTG